MRKDVLNESGTLNSDYWFDQDNAMSILEEKRLSLSLSDEVYCAVKSLLRKVIVSWI